MDDARTGQRSGRRGVAAVAVIALAACGGGRGSAPALASRAVGVPRPLLAMVPADAGAVLHLAPGLFERAPDLVADSFRTELRRDLADGEYEAGSLGHAFATDLATGDDGLVRVLGWRRGLSEVVLWSEGEAGVLRARLDGAALRASLERAERTSGTRLPRKRAGAGEYVAWDADGRTVLARLTDDELVVVLAPTNEAGLALLMDDLPPPRSFDPGPVVATLFPGRADAHFAMMIDPRWIAGLARAHADTDDAPPACRDAIIRLVGGLPSIHSAWASSSRETELVGAIALAPATADRLRGGLHPIPHWPSSEQYAVMGFGLSLAVAAEVGLGWIDEVDEAVATCGGSLDELAGVRRVATMPLVTELEAGAAAFDVAADAVGLAIQPRDLAGYWRALRAIVPLRPQPPAIGERVTMPDAMLTSDGRALLGSQGRPIDEPVFTALRDAPPGPTAIFAISMGDAVLRAFAAENEDEEDIADYEMMLRSVSAMTFEVGVRDRYLTSRVIFRHR